MFRSRQGQVYLISVLISTTLNRPMGKMEETTMIVKELIERLRDMDEELEVMFSYNYGDYTKTMVAADICNVDESEVVYSEYHRMSRIADDEDESERSQIKKVVILN